MGIYRWYAAAVLTVVSFTTLATERIPVDPYIKAGPGYSATTGSLTGYIPTKSNETLLLEAERKGWLPPSGPATKTPLTMKAKVKVPVAGIATKVKDVVKGNAGAIALNGAIALAIAGVGWIIDEGSVVKKKEKTAPPDQYCWKFAESSIGTQCTSPVALAAAFCQFRGDTGCKVALIQSDGSGMVSTGDGVRNAAIFSRGTCPGAINSFGDCVLGYYNVPPSEEDYPDLDKFIGGLDPDWLKRLLEESCSGSNAPQRCLDSLQKQMPPELSGPSTVAGPSTTTTGTYTRPDGTTGTTGSKSDTTYNIRYGDTYVDVTTNTTTTNTKDGVTESTSETTDDSTPQEQPPEEEDQEKDYVVTDSALPKIDPFYEQQYPDGLHGVWDEKQGEFQDSAFVSFLHSFVPSFSGSCPAFSLSFAIASWANYGTIPFSSICYALDLVKVVILVSALFLCRAVIFGG